MFPIIPFDLVKPEEMIYTGCKTQLTKYDKTKHQSQNLQTHTDWGQDIS